MIMCGIAGIITFDNKKINPSEIKAMTDKLEHRGPNDEGYYISPDKKVGLGNRRLAIIDLSAKGHQPMSFKNRYWITTNSEIYNFLDEKQKLIKVGYKFDSECDTEVILALYDRYKEKCLEHLRGMFAFCIYDSKENTVFLARDRIGVKPLKYYFDNENFIFASEAKAILTQKEVDKRMDLEAIRMYLVYGYIPSPLTGFKGIHKLEPGNYMKIDLSTKKLIKKRYWEPEFDQKLDLSESQWCERILDSLEESTNLRMVSDVPVGAFLSGGVDSSGVVAAMARVSKKQVNTFTITFSDKDWDESKYARKIARMYKTNHTELQTKPADFDLLPEIAYMFEEPYADAGCLVNYMVNSLAKKYITVVLNGDGGDENFAGYPNRYIRIRRDVRYDNLFRLIRPTSLAAITAVNKISPNTKFQKGLKFLEKSKLPLYRRFLSYNQIFDYKELSDLAAGDLAGENDQDNIYSPIRKCFETFNGCDLKDAGLKFELLYWLPDDLLAKADLMSMANSIETRSPFLDHKFIEMTGKIPFDLKLRGEETKYILKKALEKIVPKENLYRQKRGFGIPLSKWFSGKLNKYARQLLLSKRSLIKRYVNTDLVKMMLDEHSEANDYGPKLWTLLSLELWLRSYFPD